MGNGLQKVLMIHGEIQAGEETWVWDYATMTPRKKSEMTAKEYREAKKAHKNKGILIHVGRDKIEYGPKSNNQ